jgi:FkbM family methyltransferase
MLRKLHEKIADGYRGVDGVIERGVGEGLRFNAGDSYAGYLMGTWEPATQDAFAAFVKPGDVVYDGGASVGFWTVLAARLAGPTGRVVSFEPLAANIPRIEHNVRLNGFTNVEVRAEALGAADGSAHFLVSADAGWGRIGEAGSHLNEKVAEIEVPVRSIDSLVRGGVIPPPAFIKLDVEGAEADVLRGAVQTLRTARPALIVELHGTADEVQRILVELDYSVTLSTGPTSGAPDSLVAVPRG